VIEVIFYSELALSDQTIESFWVALPYPFVEFAHPKRIDVYIHQSE